MSAHTTATPEQEQVLRQAATLSRILQQTWSRADSYDVVMLLVAELLEAHADTGIDLGTWPVPLAAVVSHLAQDPEGCEVLRAAAIEPWFTVIGTTKSSHREAVAVIPGRRHLETAIGAWATQVQAPTAADAVSAAVSKHLQHTYLAAPTGNDAQPREAVRRTDRCLLDDRSGDESRFYAH